MLLWSFFGRLASVEIEAKYQKVLIQQKQKSDECDQLQRNLNATKQEVTSLVEKLSLVDKVGFELRLLNSFWDNAGGVGRGDGVVVVVLVVVLVMVMVNDWS